MLGPLGAGYWVLSWLTKYQSLAEPLPGRVALIPVTCAPAGRVSLAQAPGPQDGRGDGDPGLPDVAGVTPGDGDGRGQDHAELLSAAVIQTAALAGVCGVAQVDWTVPPVFAVKLSSASANCGP